VRDQYAVRPPRDDIGKGAATVNPELPARVDCLSNLNDLPQGSGAEQITSNSYFRYE